MIVCGSQSLPISSSSVVLPAPLPPPPDSGNWRSYTTTESATYSCAHTLHIPANESPDFNYRMRIPAQNEIATGTIRSPGNADWIHYPGVAHTVTRVNDDGSRVLTIYLERAEGITLIGSIGGRAIRLTSAEPRIGLQPVVVPPPLPPAIVPPSQQPGPPPSTPTPVTPPTAAPAQETPFARGDRILRALGTSVADGVYRLNGHWSGWQGGINFRFHDGGWQWAPVPSGTRAADWKPISVPLPRTHPAYQFGFHTPRGRADQYSYETGSLVGNAVISLLQSADIPFNSREIGERFLTAMGHRSQVNSGGTEFPVTVPSLNYSTWFRFDSENGWQWASYNNQSVYTWTGVSTSSYTNRSVPSTYEERWNKTYSDRVDGISQVLASLFRSLPRP